MILSRGAYQQPVRRWDKVNKRRVDRVEAATMMASHRFNLRGVVLCLSFLPLRFTLFYRVRDANYALEATTNHRVCRRSARARTCTRTRTYVVLS